MRKISDVWHALGHLKRLRDQVELVALSKIDPRTRKIFYVIDTLIFMLPYVLIGVALESWPAIGLVVAVLSLLCFSHWRDVEAQIPQVIEQSRLMREGSDSD